MKAIDVINNWIENISRQECWAVAAGGCVGTAFTMQLGERTKRTTPLKNPTFSESQRLFESSFSLYAQDSHWILGTERPDRVTKITDSNDDYSPDGAIANGLQSLVGNFVSSAEYDPKTHDLDLFFQEDGLRLKVFGAVSAGATAYSLFLPTQVVSVEGGGVGVEIERRQ